MLGVKSNSVRFGDARAADALSMALPRPTIQVPLAGRTATSMRPSLMLTTDVATVCAHFWTGICVGVKTLDESSDWAYSIIEAMDKPPIEIIEIATAHGREESLEALKQGTNGADWQAAGRLLLMDTRERLLSGEHTTVAALWIAIKIGHATDISDDLMIKLDLLEDDVNLVSSGMVTAKELQLELADLLNEYGSSESDPSDSGVRP